MKKLIAIIIFSAVISIIGFQAVLAANVSLNCDTNAYPWCVAKKSIGGSEGLVDRFYTIALTFVGLTAFGAMVFGAIKYTLSEGNPGKMQDALAWIWGAVWGIILLLGGWLLLNTINSEIVSLKSPENEMSEVKLIKQSVSPWTGQWTGPTTFENNTRKVVIIDGFTNDQCQKRTEVERSGYPGSTASFVLTDVKDDRGKCVITVTKK